MQTFMYTLIPIVVVLVALVLFAGLWNMVRDGSTSRSQNLMRWRVGLQFAAVVLIMTTVYLF